MLSGPDLGPAPTALDKGRYEGALSSRRPLYSPRRGSAATEQRVPLPGGLPPARGGGAAASQPLPPRARRGGGRPARPRAPPSLSPLALQAAGGAEVWHPPRQRGRDGGTVPRGPTGMGQCRLPAEPARCGNPALPGLLFFLSVLFINFQCAPPRITPRDPRGAGRRGGLGAEPASSGSQRRWLYSCKKVSHATGDASQRYAGLGRF